MKLLFALVVSAGLMFAADPWNKDPQKWTANDAQRILNASPWAQSTNAVFDAEQDNEPPPPGPLPGAAQAGMAGPRGYSDGNWDGGVGKMPRGSTPSLPILIRWDSALPLREAAEKAGAGDASSGVDAKPVAADVAAKDYVITLIGLVPAKRYRNRGQLSASSDSDGKADARDPEEMLEGLMANTRLVRRGRPALAPENVRLDAETGTLRVFFPRTDPITASDRDLLFLTHFGAITVRKVFRPADMTCKGRLEL